MGLAKITLLANLLRFKYERKLRKIPNHSRWQNQMPQMPGTVITLKTVPKAFHKK